jgi:hypothetical protein
MVFSIGYNADNVMGELWEFFDQRVIKSRRNSVFGTTAKTDVNPVNIVILWALHQLFSRENILHLPLKQVSKCLATS